jgi:calcium-dependent protein kinase
MGQCASSSTSALDVKQFVDDLNKGGRRGGSSGALAPPPPPPPGPGGGDDAAAVSLSSAAAPAGAGSAGEEEQGRPTSMHAWELELAPTETTDLNTVYKKKPGRSGKILKGSFGIVEVIEHKKTGDMFALKSIHFKNKKARDPDYMQRVLQEVNLLKTLDHPHIVRLHAVYVTKGACYLVMDLLEGGDLAEKYKFESEDMAKEVVRQVVFALRYLHSRGVAHRDLKLDNLIYESKDPHSRVRLVDFGLSGVFQEGEKRREIVGSLFYAAPEILKGSSYDPFACDLWSLGILTYVLLCGKPPFSNASVIQTRKHIAYAKLDFRSRSWDNISEPAKHFIRLLLQRTPTLRPDIKKVQEHPWLTEGPRREGTAPGDVSALREEAAQNLISFRHANAMKRLALVTVAHTLLPSEMAALSDEFSKADIGANGEISLEEFKRAIAASPSVQGLGEKEVEEVFASIDADGTGLIHLNEFMAAGTYKWVVFSLALALMYYPLCFTCSHGTARAR